jgi:AraC family transcriptional regulator
MNSAVERAVNYIWERYSEPLSLADIARCATLSPFHFSRIFKDVTGISPGRFLAAVRIYQAKRMLLATSMNVADVSAAVGYNSLGSFTNRFTDSVGISPSRFRWVAQNGGAAPPGLPLGSACRGQAGLAGTILLPKDCAGARVYLGVFDSPIVQRRPRADALLEVESAGPYPCRLAAVPDGRWFVHAVALAVGAPGSWTRGPFLVGARGPVRVAAGTVTFGVINLRPALPADPPVLLALPDLECHPAELALSAEPVEAG